MRALRALRASPALRRGARALSSSSASSAARPLRVAVIGAGVAGLQAAKAFLAERASVTTYERGARAGGVWTANYHGLAVQVPRDLYEFPDMPWRDDEARPGSYPGAGAVAAYVERYARESGVLPTVRFGVGVTAVDRVDRVAASASATPKDGVWRVRSTDGREETFDYVVVATGLYSTPAVPRFPNDAGFRAGGGAVMHSSEFKSQDQVRGKRVVVVGGGKSAIDVALEARASGAAAVTVALRHAHWGTPRLLAGLIPFQFVFLSRFGQALVEAFKGVWPESRASARGLDAAQRSGLGLVMRPVFGIVEALFAAQLGHYGAYRPERDVVADFYGFAQVLSPEFRQRVKRGEIKLERGEIVDLDGPGRAAVVAAGSAESAPRKRVDCDVVIAATGFRPTTTDVFDAATRKALAQDEDGLWLWRHTLPPHVPDLAFCGSGLAVISKIATYGIQARWIAAVATGKIKVPAPEEQAANVREIQAWKRSWMPPTASRASLVLLHQVHFNDVLCADLGESGRRKGNPIAEWFAPYRPRDYAGVVRGAVKA